jgi:L-ascorbate metabolism protein UlaG (beta-lactamase superfamily)
MHLRGARVQLWHQRAQKKFLSIPAAPRTPDPRQWPDYGLFAAWLGHSTVLIKMDGFTMITDPVLGSHVGVDLAGVTQVGLKRLVAPAMHALELPQIDLILLSHAHFDHFDIPTLRALDDARTEVVTAWRTAELLVPHRYGRVQELRWREEARVGPVRVKAVEVNHWGARYRTDTFRGYNGYLIAGDRFRVLFGGDTADTDAFREIRAHKRIDLAIMPIGAYNPWLRKHCTPEQALRMGLDAGAVRFLPIHHQTFRLGMEPLGEPIERFQEAAERERVPVVAAAIGDQAELD